jgi:dCMP deaminase
MPERENAADTIFNFRYSIRVPSPRPTWNQYFLNIAREVASRATCPRASVGAVLVKDNRILSTGYNGAPAGSDDCLTAGCLIVNNHCLRATHAEVNAVGYAARKGVSVEGATLYLYGRDAVCEGVCQHVITAAGINHVIVE